MHTLLCNYLGGVNICEIQSYVFSYISNNTKVEIAILHKGPQGYNNYFHYYWRKSKNLISDAVSESLKYEYIDKDILPVICLIEKGKYQTY